MKSVTTFSAVLTALLLSACAHAELVIDTVIGTGHLDIDVVTYLAADASGNIFFSSAEGQIRKYDAATKTTLALAGQLFHAGYSGDNGPAVDAKLNNPVGILIDAAGNIVFVDGGNNRVRKIDTKTGIISTIAGDGTAGFGGDGGPATAAQLSIFSSGTVFLVGGIARDGAGNIYFADSANQRIRVIKASDGTIQTVAGNGKQGDAADGQPATSNPLNFPADVTVDPQGVLYFTESNPGRVRRVDLKTGILTTLVGPTGLNLKLSFPVGLCADKQNFLYVADAGEGRIHRIDLIQKTAGIFAGGGTVALDGCEPTSAALNFMLGVNSDGVGNVYLAEFAAARGRRIRQGSATNVDDSDLDGFTDAIETAAGSDPHSAASTPFGSGIGESDSTARVSLKATIDLSHTGNDTVTLKGAVALASAGQPPLNDKILVAVNNVPTEFTLSNGVGTNGKARIKVVYVRGEPAVTFTVTLPKGNYRSILTANSELVLMNKKSGTFASTVNTVMLFRNVNYAKAVFCTWKGALANVNALQGKYNVAGSGFGSTSTNFGAIHGRH